MVVVDRSPEAKAALQWALSHSVRSDDTVVLVQTVRPSCKHGKGSEMAVLACFSNECVPEADAIESCCFLGR